MIRGLIKAVVVNPFGDLAEDQWWSQGYFLRSNKAYKEELRLYRLSLLLDDMKASKVGTEVEIRLVHNTGGNRLCGTSELSASELIIDLFAQETERVGDLCALTLQLSPLSSSKCLEGEVACKTLAEKATSVLAVE
jgi:hypothetical protein